MNKLDKLKIQFTVSGEIAIVELENNQPIEGLSLLKNKSSDKSNEAMLSVMSFLKGQLNESENTITVESSLGFLTFVSK